MVDPDARIIITKTMSLTLDDFVRGIAVLSGEGFSKDVLENQCVRFSVGHGHVDIRFEKREAEILGGLLALPRACVTLTFSGVEQEQIIDYVARFDLAFQRGGG